MVDIIGRKTGGRAPGTPRTRSTEPAASPDTPAEAPIYILTHEEVEAMGPREVLMRAMRRALLEGILPLAAKIATDLMPYHYAKKIAAKEHDPDAQGTETIADDPDPKVKD